jgi:hypothetical protein
MPRERLSYLAPGIQIVTVAFLRKPRPTCQAKNLNVGATIDQRATPSPDAAGSIAVTALRAMPGPIEIR